MKYGMKTICDGLYLHRGTVKRWLEKKEVRISITLIFAIAEIEVDYSKYSDKDKISSSLTRPLLSIVIRKH